MVDVRRGRTDTIPREIRLAGGALAACHREVHLTRLCREAWSKGTTAELLIPPPGANPISRESPSSSDYASSEMSG